MAVTKNETDVTWGIRGVPQPLIEKVKKTAQDQGINIGKIVELSLKQYFEQNADKTNAELEFKIEAILETKLKEFKFPNPA